MSSVSRRLLFVLCCLIAAVGAVPAVASAPAGTAKASSRAVVAKAGSPARMVKAGPPERGSGQHSSALAVGSLTAEHMTNPLGIDTGTPQLGWVISSAARGVSQSRYQIRVADHQGSLESGRHLVWDSGPVNSEQSFDVSYGGPSLASQTRYYWQVRVWDNHGSASPWSKAAWF